MRPGSERFYCVSAMSYGALSKNAVLSLNGGVQLGNFADNTGEGSNRTCRIVSYF